MRADRLVVPENLESFLGNRRVVEVLRRALEQDRLPHALIFAGPAGAGKCTLAILLARHLNCLSPGARGACGTCSICRKTLAVLKSRYLTCLSPKGEIPCGGCMNCRVLSDQHPDVRLIEPEKTMISIQQVRSVIGEISFQPFEAKYRVVILDPAEQMRLEAHNSLLKTLEEPASRTIIILVTTNPYLLITTIRSRSRMLQFGGIPEDQIADYLAVREGRSREEARLAAVFSHGSLASALNLDNDSYRELRSRALRFLSVLLKRGSFFDASSIAGELVKDKKDKESFTIWLESVESLLRDIYFIHVAPDRVSQRDLLPELTELARKSVPRLLEVLLVEGRGHHGIQPPAHAGRGTFLDVARRRRAAGCRAPARGDLGRSRGDMKNPARGQWPRPRQSGLRDGRKIEGKPQAGGLLPESFSIAKQDHPADLAQRWVDRRTQ